MNSGTALFALKALIDGTLHFARRADGTKGKEVCVIWNTYARNYNLFTHTEVEAIRARYPATQVMCVGSTETPERFSNGKAA